MLGDLVFKTASGLVAIALVTHIGCGTAKPGGMSEPTLGLSESKTAPLESAEILRRTKIAQPVSVKHVLIGWQGLEQNYGGDMDSSARGRSRFDAEGLVRRLSAELKGGSPIEPMMIEHSADRGTKNGTAIRVTTDSDYVPRFIALSIRLAVGESGVVKTGYGYHLIKRVK